jgi:AraC-like DNA-binding protein
MSQAIAVWHGPFGRATVYELDQSMAMHAHREAHLIFSLAGPPGCVDVAGTMVTPSSQIGAAISPWERHRFLADPGARPGHFLILYLDTSWFRTVGHTANELRFGSPAITLTPDIHAGVHRLADRLVSDRADRRMDTVIFELSHLCMAQSWAEAARRPIQTSDDGIDFRVRKSMTIITDRFKADPDFDRVARDSGLSRPHFYRLFREQTGVTPLIFLNTLRMERAVALVASTRDSITAIAEALGFSCQSVFTRFFATHVGMAPSDYRRAARVVNG